MWKKMKKAYDAMGEAAFRDNPANDDSPRTMAAMRDLDEPFGKRGGYYVKDPGYKKSKEWMDRIDSNSDTFEKYYIWKKREKGEK